MELVRRVDEKVHALRCPRYRELQRRAVKAEGVNGGVQKRLAYRVLPPWRAELRGALQQPEVGPATECTAVPYRSASYASAPACLSSCSAGAGHDGP